VALAFGRDAGDLSQVAAVADPDDHGHRQGELAVGNGCFGDPQVEGERGDGGERTDRRDAGEDQGLYVQQGREEARDRHQGREHAEGTCHSLAAAEAEVDREDVAEGGREADERQAALGVGEATQRSRVHRPEHRQVGLEQVEQEHDDAQLLAEHTNRVGGTDVAGAELTDVDAAGQADEHTHGDRRHEVGEEAPGEGALAEQCHAADTTARRAG
jgi:hypothetical protein